ncbi:hypothetical protein EMPS_06965 [Entomortierella parvispora]|uniref:N-acetyltransferase domain-containing protein n=1 Tax=Entomortierella parvispora TaxID=205924 RepID=A0A9P3HDF5_9FUNG|nr:hypothetical protein EMPS_06965 [Entomortierella parvispora]
MVTTSIPIRYTRIDKSLYSQNTLGEYSGLQIETDNILLEPLLIDRDAPKLWNLYKDHLDLFHFFPHGPLTTYEKFYAVQKRFCDSPEFSNWTVHLLVDTSAEGQPSKEKTRILCGSICLLDIQPAHRRCEVGAIWFHPAVHGTTVMLESTYMLLRLAFGRLQSGRVQWKTHHANVASQKAALKLGFEQDGLHRKHLLNWDGIWRHSYFYSMTDDDWFGVPVTTTPGAAQEPLADGLEGLGLESKGKQLALETKIAERRKTSKPFPASVLAGQPLA